MSGIPHDHYEPKSNAEKWLHRRLPIVGLLYDTIGRNTHEDVRVRTIESMCERYSVDLEQAQRVEATALRCLDQVAYAWGLHHPDLRQQLSWAARLHEIGLALSYSGNHQHGAYLVANTDMPGFSQHKQAFLAALIRAHRRRLRPDNFAELRQVGGEEAVYLALILRLAAALNRGRDTQPLPPFTLSAAANTIELQFPHDWLRQRPMTSADLENEREFLAEAGFHFSAS